MLRNWQCQFSLLSPSTITFLHSKFSKGNTECVCVCVSMGGCVCVCVCERERERDWSDAKMMKFVAKSPTTSPCSLFLLGNSGWRHSLSLSLAHTHTHTPTHTHSPRKTPSLGWTVVDLKIFFVRQPCCCSTAKVRSMLLEKTMLDNEEFWKWMTRDFFPPNGISHLIRFYHILRYNIRSTYYI